MTNLAPNTINSKKTARDTTKDKIVDAVRVGKRTIAEISIAHGLEPSTTYTLLSELVTEQILATYQGDDGHRRYRIFGEIPETPAAIEHVADPVDKHRRALDQIEPFKLPFPVEMFAADYHRAMPYVITALDAGYRTFKGIRSYYGLPRAVAIETILERMENENVICKLTDGPVAAFFRIEDQHTIRKYWLAGDGRIEHELVDKPVIRDEDAKFTELNPYNGNNPPKPPYKSKGRARKPVDATKLESLAATLPSMRKISTAVGFSSEASFAKRLKNDPELKAAFDRGRARRQTNPTPDPEAAPEPSEPVELGVPREKLMFVDDEVKITLPPLPDGAEGWNFVDEATVPIFTSPLAQQNKAELFHSAVEHLPYNLGQAAMTLLQYEYNGSDFDWMLEGAINSINREIERNRRLRNAK
jgi:hypothetical protein